MSFIWEWYQQNRILNAETSASDARRRADSAQAKSETLQQQVDRLTLMNAALWTILRERLSLGDVDLLERMDQLDASDGAIDGRYRPPPRLCPACLRRSASTSPRCMYCGRAFEDRSPI